VREVSAQLVGRSTLSLRHDPVNANGTEIVGSVEDADESMHRTEP
jgi:hypothetical protein